MKIYAPCR